MAQQPFHRGDAHLGARGLSHLHAVAERFAKLASSDGAVASLLARYGLATTEAVGNRLKVRDADAPSLIRVTSCLVPRITTLIVPETLYWLLWKLPLYLFSPTIRRTAVCVAVAEAVVQTAFTA